MTNVEHICERKYFYWATWEGWMNLFLLSYPKYINTIIQSSKSSSDSGGNFMALPCGPLCTYYSKLYTKY